MSEPGKPEVIEHQLHWTIDIQQYRGAARVVRRIMLGAEPAIVISPTHNDPDTGTLGCTVEISGDMTLEAAAAYLASLSRAITAGLHNGQIVDDHLTPEEDPS